MNHFFKAKRDNSHHKVRKTFKIKPNNNSADYIAPSFIYGCPTSSCLYCYTSRNNLFGNPKISYKNLDEIIHYVIKFNQSLPKYKDKPNQQDAKYFVLDIGENTDLLSSRNLDITNYLLDELLTKTNFKLTFATKNSSLSNLKKLRNNKDRDRVRIRTSLMPHLISKKLEKGTVPIKNRILNINHIYQKGYECHLNFSPVVLHINWQSNYRQLFQDIHDALLLEVKNDLKCEVIFLTHSFKLHQLNTSWDLENENLLWTPPIQEVKNKQNILRYNIHLKHRAIRIFKDILKDVLPYCHIRYIF